MDTADRHIYKLVVLAGIFAVLIYFQRKSGKLDKVQNLDSIRQEKIKLVDTRVFETDKSSGIQNYNGRRLKWIRGANHGNGMNTLWSESITDSGSGSGDSDDAEVRDFPNLSDVKKKKKKRKKMSEFQQFKAVFHRYIMADM